MSALVARQVTIMSPSTVDVSPAAALTDHQNCPRIRVPQRGIGGAPRALLRGRGGSARGSRPEAGWLPGSAKGRPEAGAHRSPWRARPTSFADEPTNRARGDKGCRRMTLPSNVTSGFFSGAGSLDQPFALLITPVCHKRGGHGRVNAGDEVRETVRYAGST